MTSFDINYSYAQVAVFFPALDRPFNDWSDRHVNQGFAWRDKSVSFRMFNEEGSCKVTVVLAGRFDPAKDTERAFVVPFNVETCGIEVGSISDSRLIDVPAGQYALYFEIGRLSAGGEWISIPLVPQAEVEPQVTIADHLLSPTYPLEMSANPA